MKKWLVTGGAGFIGTNFIMKVVGGNIAHVLNIDKLTYAGMSENLDPLMPLRHYGFCQEDICDQSGLERQFLEFQPDAVINFAAETHVDRSIDSPEPFFQTNVIGTMRLLNVIQKYLPSLAIEKRRQFRFLHVSTDEVYGDLEEEDLPFSEKNQYRPNSPYAASKAGSDHLVRSYWKTFHLPAIISNCSNNYGPYQFPEKLIPLTIIKALNWKPIPIYGDGLQRRDWIYVEDHVDALLKILESGEVGETYNVGGGEERANLEIVTKICRTLDRLTPGKTSYQELITHVKDRPGHDRRYAINAEKIKSQLGFECQYSLEMGLEKTISWYINHRQWWEKITQQRYQGHRLGVKVEADVFQRNTLNFP